MSVQSPKTTVHWQGVKEESVQKRTFRLRVFVVCIEVVERGLER